MDDGADVIGVLHAERPDMARRHHRRHRRDDHRRHPPEGARGRGQAHVPDRRRQRRQHQAPVRQPLRHRPEHARRHHPRHQHPDRRQHRRRGRLRLVRARPGDAHEGPRRRRHRARGRPAARPRGRHGRLPRHADRRGRQGGRLFVTATGDIHVIARRALRGHEGRRHRRQLRPLQRRDRHPGAREAGRQEAHACASSSRSTRWPTAAASTCWPKAGWSTWRRPRAIRPRSWT